MKLKTFKKYYERNTDTYYSSNDIRKKLVSAKDSFIVSSMKKISFKLRDRIIFEGIYNLIPDSLFVLWELERNV